MSSKKADKYTVRPELWDRRYSQKDRETLLAVATQYGLDPMTREVMMLTGNIYVTAAGLQKLAIRDPSYDGCEIDIVTADWEKNFFVAKARVWKKDCGKPFEDFGDASSGTSKLKGHALFRHAITRARARAMRSAFAIPFCSIEELDDDLVPPKPQKISPENVRLIIEKLKSVGLDKDGAMKELLETFGLEKFIDLTEEQGRVWMQVLSKRDIPVSEEGDD